MKTIFQQNDRLPPGRYDHGERDGRQTTQRQAAAPVRKKKMRRPSAGRSRRFIGHAERARETAQVLP
jgi:hypothetical protein